MGQGGVTAPAPAGASAKRQHPFGLTNCKVERDGCFTAVSAQVRDVGLSRSHVGPDDGLLYRGQRVVQRFALGTRRDRLSTG